MPDRLRLDSSARKPKFHLPVTTNQPRPIAHEPGSQSTRQKIAICSTFKDEAPFLDEWVAFHRKQGVDHFYLYNNFSTDEFAEALAPHQSYVTVTDWPIPYLEGGQLKALLHAIETYGASYRWLVMIDIDEFVFGPNRPLADELALDPFASADQVVINTINYGTSSVFSTPKRQMLSTLVRRAPLWWQRNAQRKCIVNPGAVTRVPDVHEMEMARNSIYVSGSGSTIKPSKTRRHRRGMGRVRSLRRIVSRLIFRMPHLVQLIPPSIMLFLTPYEYTNFTFFDGVSRIRINHYVLRSKSHFEEKKRRFVGTQFESKYDESYFKYHDQNQVHDPVLADWDGKGLYLNREGNR